MKNMQAISTQARPYILAEVPKAAGDFMAASIVTSANAAAAIRHRSIHFLSAAPASARPCVPKPIKTEKYSTGISAQTIGGVCRMGPAKARTSPAATIIITLIR